MKRFGLVLALLLFGSLMGGTGSAIAGQTTQYFVDVMRSVSEVQSVLSSTTWAGYTPNITSIVQLNESATRIYFSTEKDLARFLIPANLKTTTVFSFDRIRVSEQVVVIHVHYSSGHYGSKVIGKVFNFTKITKAYGSAVVYNHGGGSDKAIIKDLSGSNLVTSGHFGGPFSKTGYQFYIEDEEGDGAFPKYDFWVVFVGKTTFSTQGSVSVYTLKLAKNKVFIHVKDALTGQPLTGVTVKEGDTTLGTIDDGGTLELTKGTHTLTFEKSGYWSETVTVDVQNDTSVSVEMYPDTAAFRISAPAEITTFENTITEVTFTVSPIKTEATYNAYLSLSGLTGVIEVKEGANTLSPEAGKYYLGDVSGETQITVKFRPSGQGTRAFTFTITSQDVLGTKTYTTTKQVKYKVDPLPFQVQLPSTWTVGDNTVRINEASGQQVLITLSLIDSQGNEVWTDSYSFGPYEGHSFTVSIPAEGTYTLKASWAGYTATWTVEVNPAISLVTDTITVKEGEIGTVQVHIENPTSNTQYYTIELTGGFVEGNVTKQVAVAPHSEKTVELAFSVPRGLDFDAYDLTLKVLQGSAVQYQGTVHVIIDGSGGLSLPLAGGSSNTLLLLGAAGAGLALVGLAVSRKRG